MCVPLSVFRWGDAGQWAWQGGGGRGGGGGKCGFVGKWRREGREERGGDGCGKGERGAGRRGRQCVGDERKGNERGTWEARRKQSQAECARVWAAGKGNREAAGAYHTARLALGR